MLRILFCIAIHLVNSVPCVRITTLVFVNLSTFLSDMRLKNVFFGVLFQNTGLVLAFLLTIDILLPIYRHVLEFLMYEGNLSVV